MSIIPTQNGNVSIKRSELLFSEGQHTQSVNILLQGKADVYLSICDTNQDIDQEGLLKSSYKLFGVDQNLFIGATDWFNSRKYSFSYRAAEDSCMYVFPAQSMEQVKALMNSQKDYGAYFVSSACYMISASYAALSRLERFIMALNTLSDNLSIYYWVLKEEYGFSGAPNQKFFRDSLEYLQKMKEKNFTFPAAFTPSFFDKDHSDLFEVEYPPIVEANLGKIDYYKRLYNIPMDLRKSFFGADLYVTNYHCKDAAALLEEIQSQLRDGFKLAGQYFSRLYREGEECIFSEYVRAAAELRWNPTASSLALQLVEYILQKIRDIVAQYKNEYNHSCSVDLEFVGNMFNYARNSVKSPGAGSGSRIAGNIEISGGMDSIPEELQESARRIVEYSRISRDKAELFLTNLEIFRGLNDRFRLDQEAGRVRSAVSSVFFDIYEAVFKRVISEANPGRLYEMFLNYGYADEKLLKPEHLLTLYKLNDKSSDNGLCRVYTMKDWLTGIYNMEKDPSISEFGMDYFDVFREKKKRKEVTDRDKARYDNDVDGRLNYEIFNMLRVNQKLCHGQISVYFPVLHDEMISKDLSKAFVTADMVNESIRKIMEVDYSIFNREVFYNNPDKGIEKELIMKAYPADILLMPTFGTRSIMWQELTGRSRSTPGRFILPAFTCENLDDFMLKIMGNFRWELCRTMMGVSWNDITQKSLTSEYSDFIQFYKKNKDIPEEAKEKVKAQIAKYRNSLRDIFTADYELWINYEAKGVRRLNKVVRGILYRHCSLPKAIRDSLANQPMYSDLAAAFNHQRAKLVRELENRYSKYIKNGVPLDPDLEDNLKFYKDM